MKERPILFSEPMVRAILEGRKTQTRRLVKDCDIKGRRKLLPGELDTVGSFLDDNKAGEFCAYLQKYEGVKLGVASCPYGEPGDRLWVREAFAYCKIARDHEGKDRIYSCHRFDSDRVLYRADTGLRDDLRAVAWRPSIHMPRLASRITLEITEIRVQRLQDISEDDVWKEGVDRSHWRYDIDGECWPASDSQARQWFRPIWESIHGPDSWELNPWVWAISFNRVEVSE